MIWLMNKGHKIGCSTPSFVLSCVPYKVRGPEQPANQGVLRVNPAMMRLKPSVYADVQRINSPRSPQNRGEGAIHQRLMEIPDRLANGKFFYF